MCTAVLRVNKHVYLKKDDIYTLHKNTGVLGVHHPDPVVER